ncbi:hypothetical protein LF1_28250 [Rubripirellula obstinata]|uniref:DUF1844 domain-containing protein n=1 Tax=Rubripirellula obstinata TaxID=406547 RepID=A0A5B1CI99_9BACT|nr:DUF1844 domain-containing protein [Rubripirellula obstinata]KAA1260286.1 hypothetical protein LF1_28250 [Rubripirellula obstinata]
MSEEQEPKIVVDSDWKEQVEKERAAAAGNTSPDEAVSAPETSAAETSAAAPAEDDADPQVAVGREYPAPPPASFEVLISMMFTQAMSMLGHMPDPNTGETTVNKPYAKHSIDTLEMLGEKTKGNLTDDEKQMLSEAMHALRMAYVGAK